MQYQSALLAMAIAAVVATGCKSGNDGGGGPPTNPSPPNNPPVAAATITITAAGVNPANLVVAPGTRVTFINSDNVPHEMNSNPHPNHGDCPEIDQIGFLAVGQSKQTGNLNDVRTCGYHDHSRPQTVSLQGTIRIQ